MPISESSAIANVLMGPLSFVLEADNVLRNVIKSSSSGSLVTASVTWSLRDLSLCFELLKKGELLFASEGPRTSPWLRVCEENMRSHLLWAPSCHRLWLRGGR